MTALWKGRSNNMLDLNNSKTKKEALDILFEKCHLQHEIEKTLKKCCF